MTGPANAAATPLARLVVAVGTRWRRLAAVGLGTAVLTSAVTLLIRNRYAATVLLVPEAASTPTPSAITSLAAVAGLPLAGLAPESPQFYVSLLRSRPVQYAVLSTRFPAAYVFDTRSDSAPLSALLRIRGRTPDELLWRGEKALQRMTDVSADIKTGIIRIAVEHTSPELSAGVANAFADELQRFNQEKRQSRARARRRFLEGQVEAASQELNAAESAVRDFLERNRVHVSPGLDYQLARLQRNVTMVQARYVDLRRNLDAAAIAEVDDTPVLTVIQRAIPPSQKAWPQRTAAVVLVTALALAITVVGTVVADRDPAMVDGLRAAWRTVATTLPPFLTRRAAR